MSADSPERESFWHWSIDRYREPDVEKSLLNLQDEFDFNVNILLWSCWCAERFENLTDLNFYHAIEALSAWSGHVTKNLRISRRYLKTQTLMSETHALRVLLKEAELSSEKIEQQFLENVAHTQLKPLVKRDRRDMSRRARLNLALYAAALGAGRKKSFSVEMLSELAHALLRQPSYSGADTR